MSCPALLHGFIHHAADVGVALVGDDALGVVIQLLLTVLDVFFQMGFQRLVQLQFRQHFFIPLKELDGIPAEIPFLHLALDGLLNVGDGVLHAAGEHMGQLAGALGQCQLHGLFRCRGAALPLEGADLHHRAAQGLAELLPVDPVAVFSHQVHHVHRHHHRQPQLNQLSGEVEVSLNVGAVHDVQNGIRLLAHQVVPGHHFFQGVRGEGVDARQVLDDHILMSLEAALLLFHRDAGPVAHVLIGAGQIIEQGGFSAVRVAGQCDFQFHHALLLNVSYN